jgi:F-type H+-transporting ATPase subunit a
VNRRAVILGVVLFTIISVALSFLVIKPAKPIIEIRGEPLVVITGDGSGMFDVVILNTLLTAWIVMAVVIAFWIVVARKRSMVPSGIYNLGEAIIELIDGFVASIAGEKNGRRFFALIATLFIYIMFANWLSLTPVFNTIGMFVPLHAEEHAFHEEAIVFEESGIHLITPGAEDIEIHAEDCAAGHEGDECREHAIEEATADLDEGQEAGVLFPYLRGINTDLMTPASFAIVAVFFIQYWGITSLGFFRYMGKFISFKSPIDFFVGLLEAVAEVAKLISFSFRLFGNLLAGEILLLVMTFLIPLVSTVLVIFYGLELFVGAVQAFVFAALTLVFASLAVSHHGPEEHEHAEEAVEAAHH